MRRIAPMLLAAALALSMSAFSPAVSETADTSGDEASFTTDTTETTEEPTVLTPDPVDVTMYMHGEGDRYVDETSYELAGPPKTMDREEPTGSDFDSMQLLNYALGPNPNCAGNSLFPVWTGFLGEGTMVGEATVTLHVLGSTGGDVTVNVWADVTGQACNDSYPTPDATADVTLPPGDGSVEVTLPTDGLDPDFSIMVQVQPTPSDTPLAHTPTTQARVLYDGADVQTSIALTCQPDDVVLQDGQTEEEALEGADCLPF